MRNESVPMSEGEEVFEYTSHIDKDLEGAKRAIEKSLSELGMKDKAICEEKDDNVECVLTIPIGGAEAKTAESTRSSYISSDTVYAFYVFINASYDTIARRTTLRVYSYDYNDVIKRLVEVVDKNVHDG